MLWDKYYKIEHHKILNLLNNSPVSKFGTRKLIEVNDLSNGQYSVNKSIRFKTGLLDEAANENYKTQKNVTFKNNVRFRSCI